MQEQVLLLVQRDEYLNISSHLAQLHRLTGASLSHVPLSLQIKYRFIGPFTHGLSPSLPSLEARGHNERANPGQTHNLRDLGIPSSQSPKP